ncbi:glutaredoxin family protein [Neobacillus mesonae]|uniref:glutaredoxin family protein n=1 Tax=Neobacillus mesonae TaxID=1193713 RepID=UPI00203E70B9|nr:glutaredoxin family protein [Neobacillus mesonae]MCM3567460.1 glutaredoxin family protein [Neobacillus mesonae]
MQDPNITIYTRNHCPLCDKAKTVLLELKEEYEFHLVEVDIEQSDELTERYGLMIPVVYINGEEAAYGSVNKYEISNRLQKNRESN